MIYNQSSTFFLSFMRADIMNNKWPRSSTIPSDYNLSKFVTFLFDQPDHVQARLINLTIMQHRPFVDSNPMLNSKGRLLTIQHTACTEALCHRCETGMGGYRFQFIGPWTCLKITTVPLPPFEARRTWLQCKECFYCCPRD